MPDIKVEYLEIKRMFVSICATQGSPTLDEVKDLCVELIGGAFANIPRMSHHEDGIWQAETMVEIMRILCFRLSNWVSYEVLLAVISKFQPAMKCISHLLMCYENQLKPVLLQKLEHIAELQQQQVCIMEIMIIKLMHLNCFCF